MNEILKNMNKDERFLIDNIIGNHHIIDYGFIKKISSDKKFVDIEHASIPIDNDGLEMEKTITKNVELIFFSSSYFAFQFELKVGDGVLLLGTKDFLGDLKDLKSAKTSDYILHYKQENLKALPFGIIVENPKTDIQISQTKTQIKSDTDLDATFDNQKIKTSSNSIELNTSDGNNRIAIDNGLLDLKNTVSNLKTQLQDIWTAIISINNNLQSFVSTNAAVGSPVTPNPATLALFVADNVTANTKKTNVASFLK
jgi:hypothetical protein